MASQAVPETNQPAISVLIPIYNVEKYLRQCLDSLRDQTFSNFEAICLNDGSTDSSSAIAHEYAEQDERFRVIDKPNSGYGATMNVGLDNACGTFVAVLESDDFFYPDALETLHAAALAHNAQAVKGNFTFYWTEGNRDELHRMVEPDMCAHVVDTREDTRILFQKPSIWSGLYRRDFLAANDIRFLETPGASYQDTSFAFKVWASAARATFVENPIVHYRQDNESSSVNSKGKVFCVCEEYTEINRWLDAHADAAHEHDLRLMAQISQYNAYLWNLDRLAPEFKLEFLTHMGKEFRAYEANGTLCWDEWNGWRALNLRTLMDDPEKYLRVRNRSNDSRSVAKALFALRLGGPKALVQAVAGRAKQ
ncbi:MAG: glycosyltransferase [Slackia sp.]|nr:glycosyltransferase [Slackia sp.]